MKRILKGCYTIPPLQGVMIVTINLGLKPEAVTSGSFAAKKKLRRSRLT